MKSKNVETLIRERAELRDLLEDIRGINAAALRRFYAAKVP